MKRSILIYCIVFFLAVQKSLCQSIATQHLYFYQDSLYEVSCGIIEEAAILYFVKDTTNNKNVLNEYFIIVMCPGLYGEGFFKKGNECELTLSRDFAKIRPLLPGDGFETYKGRQNFYVAEKIEKLKK